MSTRPALGVTVGKFYPFHRGHEHLLRVAQAAVEQLVVIVGHRPEQELPGELRARWIREQHPGVEVLLALEDIPEAPEPWARRTLELLGGRRPELALTSETYGEAWAAALGCPHRAVDPPRARFPCSGSALRADLAGQWEFLTPPAKAHFARRVVVLGVESSGSTTLAEALARRYGTVWVPEYGRAYWEGRRHLPEAARWQPEAFARIARGQLRAEDDLAREARRLVVCDTDPLATSIWRRRYLGAEDPGLLGGIAPRRRDLYLLTEPDFAFVQDGTRESEAYRERMQAWFLAALAAQPAPWLRVGGSPAERLERACAPIDPLLEFAPLRDPGTWPGSPT